jgi:hypothetical protein
MRDLIFVSLENWDEIWRRNQFLCAAWARRFPLARILFVGPPELLPVHLKDRTLASLHERLEAPVSGFSNITATFIPKPFSTLFPEAAPSTRCGRRGTSRAWPGSAACATRFCGSTPTTPATSSGV